MRAKIYKPAPVLLPRQLIENNSAVQELLLGYTASYCYGANSNALLRFGLDEVLAAEGAPVSAWRQVRPPTPEERLALLKHPVPLFYDVFFCRDKLLALGPYLPGMDELLGKPRIYLGRKDKSSDQYEHNQELTYFKDDNHIPYRPGKRLDRYFSSDPRATPKFFRPLTYLVIDNLPRELLEQLNRQAGQQSLPADEPTDRQADRNSREGLDEQLGNQLDDWSLLFKYRDFEQEVKLQANPFAGAPPKSTLLTLQKDNPAEWISSWCNYYHREHGVERIIIYNNAPLETASGSPADKLPSGPESTPTSSAAKNLPYLATAPDSSASRHLPDTGTASSPRENLELYYVEWPHYYQQYFNHCQVGALNHAYHWLGNAAAYFLNFDIDEYLVNNSGESIGDYLRGEFAGGFTAACYEVPADITPPQTSHPYNKASTPDKAPANTPAPQQKDLSANSREGNEAEDNYPPQTEKSKLRESAREMLPTVNYGKCIYKPNCWDLVQVHENTREAFFIKPAYRQLLRRAKPSIGLWLAKHLYRYPFLLPSLADKLRIKEAPPEDFYFLHYRALSTNWKRNYPNPAQTK